MCSWHEKKRRILILGPYFIGAFGAFLIGIGPVIMLRPLVDAQDHHHSTSPCAETLVVIEEEERSTNEKISGIPREVKLDFLGSVAGLLNGFFGIGRWLDRMHCVYIYI